MSETDPSPRLAPEIRFPVFADSGHPEPEFYSRLVKSIPGIVYRFRLSANGEMAFDYISRDLSWMWYPEEALPQFHERLPVTPLVIHPDEGPSLTEAIFSSAQNLSPFTWTGRVLTHKNEVRWLKASSLPIPQTDESIVWDGVMLDATREKLQEIELDKIRTEFAIHARLASIGEVAATLAHEVNTPLSSLLLVTDVIEREASQPKPDLQKIIQKNRQAQTITQKIAQIIYSLLQVSRSEKPLPKTLVSVREILSNSLVLSSEQNSVRNIVVHRAYMQRENARIEAAETDLMTITSNLLQNAREAVTQSERREIWIDYEVSSDQVEVRITDSGAGISDKNREKVFRSFFTTKPSEEGTGIGLLLCRRIADRNGWKLEYSRTADDLTRFILSIPVSSPDA